MTKRYFSSGVIGSSLSRLSPVSSSAPVSFFEALTKAVEHVDEHLRVPGHREREQHRVCVWRNLVGIAGRMSVREVLQYERVERSSLTALGLFWHRDAPFCRRVDYRDLSGSCQPGRVSPSGSHPLAARDLRGRAQVSSPRGVFSPECIRAGWKDQRAPTVHSASGRRPAPRRRIRCRGGWERRKSVRAPKGSVRDGGRHDDRRRSRSDGDGRNDFRRVDHGRIEGSVRRRRESGRNDHDRRRCDHVEWGGPQGDDLSPHGLEEASFPPDHRGRARGSGAHGSRRHGRPLSGHDGRHRAGWETRKTRAPKRQSAGRRPHWQRPLSPTRQTRRRA
jgi:hypothetical protein